MSFTANRPSETLRETKLVDMTLLGFWGELDHGVGMHNVEQYDTQLDDGNKEHECIIYPGLPHAFLTFDPGNEHFEQSRESLQRTLEFSRDKLA